MKRRAMWFIVIGLLAAVLLLVGCSRDMLAAMEREIRKGGGTDYYRYLEDPGYEGARSEPRFGELIELAKQNALRENEAKAITLEEGYWYDWELESEHKLPIVNLSFQYDDRFFTIKVQVEDTHFRDGERSWRYGDGFLINFLTPKDYSDPYADEFYSYGFSMEYGRPVAVLVNKDGTWPLRNLPDFRPEIKVDQAAGTAEYLIQIPWSRLYPFHPLMDEQAGINVRYRSRDDDGTIKTLIYVPDWASEGMRVRRYAPLHFVPSDQSRFQMTGALETRLVSKDPANLELCVWAPEALSAVGSIVLEDETGQTVSEWQFEQDLGVGKSTIGREIELPATVGLYRLAVQINDSLHWEETLYRYDPEALARLEAGIQELALGATDANARNSADALEYRLKTLESRISHFGERDDPQEIKQDLKELAFLYETCVEHGSIYVKDGYLLSAFRSPLDDTLQPFSIYLPANYDPSRQYDLVVTLHGSGVDEVGFVPWQATHTFAGREVIVLGPRGRDLSGWWIGTSEDDVADLVELAHSVFKVNRTFCYGFSMGGYGVWRMGFRHPELFDGAIVVAGYPHPPWPPWNTKENDMHTYIGQAKGLPFLVIHGPNDPQLSIKATDRFVTKLEKNGYDVVYHRPEGSGHTNISVESMVNEWLDERFGQTAAPPAPTTAPTPTIKTELGSIDDTVNQQIQTLMEEGDIPSLSVGIVVNNELVWAKNYDGPAGLDTVYIVGSIQKPFTASAVLQLVERGTLDLDEDVSAYLPFPVRHPQHPDTPITIRSLLTHQSGLGCDTETEGAWVFQGDYSVYEFGEELLGIELPRLDPYPSCETLYEGLLIPGGAYYEPDVWEFEPGTVNYSNTAFQFLGCIVERVTGQPLAEYIEEHALDPLEMAHSGYSVSDLIQYHALPYERIETDYLLMDGEKVPIREGYEELVENNLLQIPLYEWAPGAGGLRTTVPDLAQFMIAHMNQGLAPNGYQLLQPETVEMMHQVAGSSDGNINSFNLVGQGMGWSLCEDGVEGHVGGQLGFGGTMVFKQPDQGTAGILVMTNVDAMYLENHRRWDWFRNYYGEIEQLLLRSAEEMLAQKSKG